MLIKRIFLYIPSIILFIILELDLKTFNVWLQIDEGFIDGNVTDYFENIVSHTVRLVLMHPIKFYSNTYGIDQDILFTYVVLLIFCFINYRVIKWTYFNFGKKRGFKISLLINFILLVFFLIINGRNSFSFLGNVLLFDAYILIYFRPRNLFYPLLGVIAGFVCNVSSGTYAVLTINLIIHYILIAVKVPFSNLFWKSTVLILFAVGFFVPILSAGLIKNLEFYDGSILKMLSHGYGSLIFENILAVLLIGPLLLILSIFIFVKFLKIRLSSFKHIRIIFILTAIIGGLFGYSSLVGALPVLLFLIATFFWDKKNNLFRYSDA